jgi:glycosyltransferase involved in cell wall biosynthesis
MSAAGWPPSRRDGSQGTNDAMKVMHVITGLRTGGAETQLALLLRHTRTSPLVVALANADEIADVIRRDGFEVYDLGMRHNHELRALARLTRLISRHRPDAVHVHLYRATLYGRIAARLAGVRTVITTEHSLLDGQMEGRRTSFFVKALYMATEPFSTATIAVSDQVAGRLSRWGVPEAKLHVIPNGIDMETLSSASRPGTEAREALRKRFHIAPEVKLVGGIGRLHRTKQWDLLLQALADDLNAELQVMLVGAGDDEPRLREVIARLGVDSWVHLTGVIPDIETALSAMDVVVSTAPQETFGLALVEAAVAGRPVVYVHSPGLDRVGEVSGVVKVSPQPSAIRAAVLEAVREPRRPPWSAFAQYDIASVARQVDGLYEACIHRSSLRAQLPARYRPS